MAKYQAKYTVNAYMFDAGAFMPDPEPHMQEYSFEAKDANEAKKIAQDHMASLRKDYFRPNITLDSLLEIKNIEL